MERAENAVRGVFPAEGVIDRCPQLRVSNSTLPTRVKSSLSLTYSCDKKNRVDSILFAKLGHHQEQSLDKVSLLNYTYEYSRGD